MSYSKGIITIPNVTGDIAITVTTIQKQIQNLLNLNKEKSTETTSGGSNIWNPAPPNSSCCFGGFLKASGARASYTAVQNVINSKTNNSISLSSMNSNQGIGYTFAVTPGNSYTLSWNASGTPRVWLGSYSNGVFSTFNGGNDIGSGATGDRTYTFTAPSVADNMIVIFGAGSATQAADYSNVLLVKN